MMRRYAILIDGSNLHETTKALGLALDHNKLLNFFEGELVRAMYFTAIPEDRSEPCSIRPMLDRLEYNGYSVVTKFTKKYLKDDGSVKVKGNMDMDMAIHAINVAPFVSDIVLVTGDGDFVCLVEHLQIKYGVRVWCMSTREAVGQDGRKLSLVSDDLRRKSDFFIDMADPIIMRKLSREDRATAVPPRFSFSKS